MDVFMGSVVAFGFNFPPYGWVSCNGQLLSIAEYSALFSLLGTDYGGDGVSTFGVPNLQGCVPVCQGNSLGVAYTMGQTGGSNSVTLTQANMPMHNHPGANPLAVPALSTAGNTTNPEGNRLAGSSVGTAYTAEAPDVAMRSFNNSTVAVTVAGGSQPLNVTDPFLAINYSLAAVGIFPARN